MPLIKSGSEWIEARVGDVVLASDAFIAHREGSMAVSRLLNNGGIMFNNGTFTGKSKDYELVKRPFMVGDEFEIDMGLKSKNHNPFDRVIKIVITEDKLSVINSGDCVFKIRHANPAWRGKQTNEVKI